MMMIKDIQFRNINNSFQSQLNGDIKQITQGSKIFVAAGKSCNIYKMYRETYQNFMHENTTKIYKKADEMNVRTINIDTNKMQRI